MADPDVPESPAPAPEAPPSEVVQTPPDPIRVKLGAREFTLPPEQSEVAQAIQERERELNTRLSQQGRQIEEFRRMAAPQPQVQPATPSPQYPEYIANPNMIFEKPGDVLQQFRNDIKQEIHRESTERYWQQQRIEGWWSYFFEANKDLVPAAQMIRGFVEATPTFHTLPPEQIADYMRQQLLGASRSAKSTAAASARTQVEGASGERPAAAPAAKAQTMSQQIQDLPGRKARGR
jgi:sugar-specific transcriptional regulator TrmB